MAKDVVCWSKDAEGMWQTLPVDASDAGATDAPVDASSGADAAAATRIPPALNLGMCFLCFSACVSLPLFLSCSSLCLGKERGPLKGWGDGFRCLFPLKPPLYTTPSMASTITMSIATLHRIPQRNTKQQVSADNPCICWRV